MIDKLYISLPAFYKNKKDQLVKYKYDYSKKAHEQGANGKEKRDNALIEMMWGVLTHPDSLKHMLNPGGFDNLKRTARINVILESTLKSSTNKYKLDNSKEIRLNNYNDLKDLTLDELEEIYNKVKSKKNVLFPEVQVYYQKQNTIAAKLIGVFASHNAFRAIAEELGMNIAEPNQISINGKKYNDLSKIQNNEGIFITKILSEFISSSVDAIKEPVLNDLNVNTFTAPYAAYLAHLGYTWDEIGLFLNQPIVKELAKTYLKDFKKGVNRSKLLLNMYDKLLEARPFLKDRKENEDITSDNLAYALSHDKNDNTVINIQHDVINMLLKIEDPSALLTELITSFKADTTNGAAGPLFANVIEKQNRIDRLIDKVSNRDSSIIMNVKNLLRNNIPIDNIDELRNQLLNSKIPFVQSFYTLGIDSIEKLVGKYVISFKPFMKDIHKMFESISKGNKNNSKSIWHLETHYINYWLSQFKMFSKDNFNRIYLELPIKLEELKNKYPDIAKMYFIDNLSILKQTVKNPFGGIRFSNVGSLSMDKIEKIANEWTDLFQHDSKEVRDLARDLFVYNYFVNGVEFGPTTFIHLASTVLKYELKKGGESYVDLLYKLLDNKKEEFIDIEQSNIYNNSSIVYLYQHLRNNLYNRSYIPDITDGNIDVVYKKDDKMVNFFLVTYDPSNKGKNVDFIAKTKTVYIDNIPTDYYLFKPIIAIVNGDETHYYREDFNTFMVTSDNPSRIYVKLNQDDILGIKNNLIQYDFNNPDFKSNIGDIKIESDDDLTDSRSLTIEDTTDGVTNNSVLKQNKIVVNTPFIETKQPIQSEIKFIYNNLGDKTQSENVVIDEVNGRKPAIETINEPKVGDITSISFYFEKENKTVDVKVKIIELEKFYQGSTTTKDVQGNIVKEEKGTPEYFVTLEKLDGSRQYKVAVNENGEITQTLGKNSKIFIGSDNYIEAFYITKENISKPIVAYRTQGNNFLKALQEDNAIGNPWSHLDSSQKNNLPTKNDKINIYAGSNQNTELSNFAIRPFKTTVETSSGSKEYTFQSVEQGFHFHKAVVANNPQVAAQILKTTNGGTLRNLTNRSNLKMTPEQVKEWDDTSKSIMLNLMHDSYAQNPDKAQLLLNTGEATITHTQDNTRWKNDFPEVVMTVRDMLKEEGFGQQDSKNQYGLYKTNTVKEAVEEFIAWVIGKKHTDKLQDYRQAIIDKIPELKGKTILYYKDLGEPSHATALDYLINKYNWSKQYKTNESNIPQHIINKFNNYKKELMDFWQLNENEAFQLFISLPEKDQDNNINNCLK